MPILNNEITIFSGHYPLTTQYAKLTRKIFEEYTQLHGYNFFYDEEEPTELNMNHHHFRRCNIIQKANLQFPNTKWFIWVDSDVYVNNLKIDIQSVINLDDNKILYHLFHEKPWKFPINTGVKFINKSALKYEAKIYELRNKVEWPFEQKAMIDYILPRIHKRYIIHDPYILNCIIKLYPKKIKNALFVHMCGTSEEERNNIMINLQNKQ